MQLLRIQRPLLCASSREGTYVARAMRVGLRSFFAADLSAIAMAAGRGGAGPKGGTAAAPAGSVSSASHRSPNGNRGGGSRGYRSNCSSGRDSHHVGVGASEATREGHFYYDLKSGGRGGSAQLKPQRQRETQRQQRGRGLDFAEEAEPSVADEISSSASASVTSAAVVVASGAESASNAFVSQSSFASARHVGQYGGVEDGPNAEGQQQRSREGAGGSERPEALAALRESQRAMRELFSEQPVVAINGALKQNTNKNAKGVGQKQSAVAVHEIPLLPVRYLKYYSHGRRGRVKGERTSSSADSSASQQQPLPSNDLPLATIATPYASRAEERLHHVRQHNLLSQIGMTKRELEGKVTPTHPAAQIAKAIAESPGHGGAAREAREAPNRLPFRCLSCFHIFEALPSKLLKNSAVSGEVAAGAGALSGSAAMEAEANRHLGRRVNFRNVRQLSVWKSANSISARREEEARNPTKCPQCSSRRVQWLLEYCHRSLHTSRVK